VSKSDGQRALRWLACEGCPRHCEYRLFRAFGKYAGGFAPSWDTRTKEQKRARERELYAAKRAGIKLPHGNKGKRHQGQQLFAEEVQGYKREAEEKRRYHRKGTVLGGMHGLKMQMWEEYIGACPLWGTDGSGG